MSKVRRLSKRALKALDPCALESRLERFGNHQTLTIPQAFEVGFTVSNLLWVAGKLRLKHQCVEFALKCAQHVNTGTTDERVKDCLGLVQDYLDGKPVTVGQLRSAHAAACTAACADRSAAARSAAEAAYAAAAAARSAAAYAAAEAAMSAAAAVAYAAAAVAARSTEITYQQQLFIEVFNR